MRIHITKIILTIGVSLCLLLNTSCQKKTKVSQKEPLIIIQKDESTNLVDDIFKYIKEGLVIIGLGAGIILGYPAIRKKLRENHIKKLLSDTQNANREMNIICNKLLDQYLRLTYKNQPVSRSEIQKVYDEVRTLSEQSLNASKEVVTFIFLFKNTLQGILRHYDPKVHFSLITSGEFYGLYIDVLSEVIFFATKIVNIPHNPSVKQIKYLSTSVEKYVSNNKYKKYKYFEQGFENNATSPLLLSFYANINNCSNFLFHRSAFKIFSSPAPVARLMFLYKIYFPIILESNEKMSFFGSKLYLHLVAVKIKTQLNKNGEKKIVKLSYANIDDVGHFVSSLTKKQFEENFKDIYIKSKGIELNKVNNFSKSYFESIYIELDLEKAKKLFTINKNALKKQMINEKKNYTQHAI